MIEQSKEGYYLGLRQTQKTIRSSTPDWQPRIIYFLKALQQQKARLERKIEREHILLTTLPELSLEIISLAKDHSKITVAQIVALTGSNRNTIKKHLKSLVEANHLKQHGVGKGTWYGLI